MGLSLGFSGIPHPSYPAMLRRWRPDKAPRQIHARLHRRGLLTTRELAARYQITNSTVREWGRLGLIKNHYADSHISALWEIPAG